MTSSKPTKQNVNILELSQSDAVKINQMKMSAKSKTRKAAQDQKRSQYFLKGPLSFNFVQRTIPDPTSRVILVARAFADMKFENYCVLSGKVWGCAKVKTNQRRRVLASLRRLSPDLEVQDRVGRTSVLFFNYQD